MRYIVKVIFFSILIFLILSLISLMFNIFVLDQGFNIGFPLTFYYQFRARGNPYLNYGFLLENGIIDVIFSSGIAYVYLIRKKSSGNFRQDRK